VKEALCWSHARRKFFVLADIAANTRRGKSAPPISPIAFVAVKRIDLLLDIERDIHGLAAEQRLAVRTERSAALVAELEKWMRGERDKLSRHAPVAQAIRLHAQALGRVQPFPRRRTHLPDQQCDRTSAQPSCIH